MSGELFVRTGYGVELIFHEELVKKDLGRPSQ